MSERTAADYESQIERLRSECMVLRSLLLQMSWPTCPDPKEYLMLYDAARRMLPIHERAEMVMELLMEAEPGAVDIAGMENIKVPTPLYDDSTVIQVDNGDGTTTPLHMVGPSGYVPHHRKATPDSSAPPQPASGCIDRAASTDTL